MHNGRLTIQDLKDTRYIDLPSTTATFSPHMTDAQWQQRFLLMKSMVEPSTEKKFYKGKGREGSYDPDQPPDRYDGATEWQYYVAWINDILRQIRKGIPNIHIFVIRYGTCSGSSMIGCIPDTFRKIAL